MTIGHTITLSVTSIVAVLCALFATSTYAQNRAQDIAQIQEQYKTERGRYVQVLFNNQLPTDHVGERDIVNNFNPDEKVDVHETSEGWSYTLVNKPVWKSSTSTESSR